VKDYSKAIEMYNSGIPLRPIASYYGVTIQAVWLALRHRGVKMRKGRVSGPSHGMYQGNGFGKFSDRCGRLVRKALNQGLLVKKPCEICGSEKHLRAHHDDYNKPLDVRWLCPRHHFEWHKKNKAIPLDPNWKGRVGNSILTEEEVKKIRFGNLSSMTTRQLSKLLKVHVSTIENVRKGSSWKHCLKH
jgi:hypothetical protein